jgi:hypothetical protein
MKKNIRFLVLALSLMNGFALQAVPTTRPVISTTISFQTPQELKGLLLNPTFDKMMYSELEISPARVNKIQKNLPVICTVDTHSNGKSYNLYFKARNNKNAVVAYKKFSAIKNSKNNQIIPSSAKYLHTNIKYQLNSGPWTPIPNMKPNPFTLQISTQ